MGPRETIGLVMTDPLTFLVLAYGIGIVICGAGSALLLTARRLRLDDKA